MKTLILVLAILMMAAVPVMADDAFGGVEQYQKPSPSGEKEQASGGSFGDTKQYEKPSGEEMQANLAAKPEELPVEQPELAPEQDLQVLRDQISVSAGNLMALGLKVDEGQDVSDRIENETCVANNYLVRKHVIRQRLTTGQLITLFKGLGYWGGATWGKDRAKWALVEGLLVGRKEGTTVDSDIWRQWLTFEELATALKRMDERVDRKISAAIKGHNGDPTAHPDIREGVTEAQEDASEAKEDAKEAKEDASLGVYAACCFAVILATGIYAHSKTTDMKGK